MPDPQVPQTNKRRRDETNDEWLALLIALGAIGGIMAYVMLRDANGEFSLGGLRDRLSPIAIGDSSNPQSAPQSAKGDSLRGEPTAPDSRDALERDGSKTESAIAAMDAVDTDASTDASKSSEDDASDGGDPGGSDDSSGNVTAAGGLIATQGVELGRELMPARAEADERKAALTARRDAQAEALPEVAAGSASVADDLDATSAPIAFVDVADDRWSKPFIDGLSERELVSGMPDVTFAPDRPVTRAELAAQIQQIFERDEPLQDSITFSDVTADYWGQAAIDKAVTIGFLSGYPNAIFAPDKSVSRLEVAVALTTGLGLTPSAAPDAVLAIFDDSEQIPDWARSKLAAATQAGFIIAEPSRSQLDPNAPATREVVAAMMYQALVWAQQAEPINSDRVVRP